MAKPIIISKTIELCDIALMLYIGIHPAERKNRQRLLVSLSVQVADIEEDDNISNTLDYDQIYHFLKGLEKSDRFDLQETVCREIIDFVLGLNGVKQVRVSTKKPDIFDDAGYVGLTMVAEKIR